MRILVAHDRDEVNKEICQTLQAASLPYLNLDTTSDVTSTRRALGRNIYDLLIIDLTLPNIKNKDLPSYVNVQNFLQEIFVLDDLHVPGDIIGITVDSEALDRISNTIGPHVMAVVAQDPDRNWKELLLDKVSYLSRALNTRSTSYNSQFDVDCLLLTALDKELSPFSEHFELVKNSRFEGSSNFSFRDKDGRQRRGIAFAIGRSGEARAATYTQSLISVFRPRLAIMTGICGGRIGKVKLGDLVVAESAVDWDYGKWSDVVPSAEGSVGEAIHSSKFQSRPLPIDIVDSDIHRQLRTLVASNWFTSEAMLKKVRQGSEGKIIDPETHLAPMASGSSVIASSEVMNRIVELNESIRGLDMECFGFYHSARKTHTIKPEFVCIKAVSDFSNGTKGDEFHSACCFYSSYMASLFIKEAYRFI